MWAICYFCTSLNIIGTYKILTVLERAWIEDVLVLARGIVLDWVEIAGIGLACECITCFIVLLKWLLQSPGLWGILRYPVHLSVAFIDCSWFLLPLVGVLTSSCLFWLCILSVLGHRVSNRIMCYMVDNDIFIHNLMMLLMHVLSLFICQGERCFRILIAARTLSMIIVCHHLPICYSKDLILTLKLELRLFPGSGSLPFSGQFFFELSTLFIEHTWEMIWSLRPLFGWLCCQTCCHWSKTLGSGLISHSLEWVLLCIAIESVWILAFSSSSFNDASNCLQTCLRLVQVIVRC